MNINIPSSFANQIAPFNPLGRQPVGEEGQETKASTFKAVEESAETARTENRTGEDDIHRNLAQKKTSDKSGAQASSAQGAGKSSGGDALAEGENLIAAQESDDEQRQIQNLAARDREVRAHERAHAAVGGQHTGAPQITYTRGPDGVAYAVAGEVSVNLSTVAGDPEATLRKAEQIQQAALAPADPSSQDRLIAAKAAQLADQARVDIQSEQQQVQRQETEAKASRREREAKAEAEREVDAAEKQSARSETQAREAQLRESQRQQSLELSRRLINIGVVQPVRSPGELLDRTI